MKTNEFENGSGNEASAKNFQQRFRPDANYSYKAESAEAVIENPARLKQMIHNHVEVQCPRLQALDDYTKARNLDILNPNNRRVEDNKSDHRAAHNFAKIINVFDTGYNTGNPIKKTTDDEELDAIINEFDNFNDVSALDSDLWEDLRKYGRAYELMYRNELDETKTKLSNVFETFVCYSLDIERKPLFGVRYLRYFEKDSEKVMIVAYTDTQIIHFKKTDLKNIKLEEEWREEHFFGEVPIIEYSPDRYRQSSFEDVIPLIDLYDSAQSDTANYMTDLNEATLVVSGDLNLNQYSVEDMAAMKNANMLLLSNGVNPDGSKSQTSAQYIYKQYDVAGTEAYKERLRKDIYSISLIPDLTDEQFGGNQSGEAMKYKLFGFEQLTGKVQKGFQKGLKKRYRMLVNMKNYLNEFRGPLTKLTITFTPNLPKAVLEEIKALSSAGAEFSQETLLNNASFVTSAGEEIERVKEENKRPDIMEQFK